MADDRKDPSLEENLREVPVDWDALENAFENNAPEVHSYLQLITGDVLRVVDGVADPQMHALIASDPRYLRIEPVSSREQYRWMEEYIPTLEDPDIRTKLTVAIDGKGAFRRFKDVLMSYGPERERWFAYRSDHLRTFIEAWLKAHNIKPVPRPRWTPPSSTGTRDERDRTTRSEYEPRRTRNVDTLRRRLREVAEKLGSRDLDTLISFAEFLRTRRTVRGYYGGYYRSSGQTGGSGRHTEESGSDVTDTPGDSPNDSPSDGRTHPSEDASRD